MTENTQSDELLALRSTFLAATSAIDSMKEPILQLSEIADALRHAISSDRAKDDKAFATFLYEDLAPGLVKRLIKERSNDDSYLRVVGELMELLVRVFAHELTNQRYNYAFYSAMTTLFNFECSIHKQHFQINAEELQKLRTAGQEWRTLLKEGDMVDVMVATDPAGRNAGWMQGKISSINQDILSIEFVLSPRGYDRKVTRWSTDIALFESKTKEDYAWRHEQVAKAVAYSFEAEVHDKSTWNKSTIIDFRTDYEGPDRRVLLAYCALRVYRDIPDGKRKDIRGTYEGWSDKFDEWVPVFSPRIMPWGSRIGVMKELDLEDDLDALIEPDQEFERLYAVPRLGLCVSALYLRMINVFGNLNGFNTIIELLKSAKEEEVNIQVMGCLAQIIALPHPVLHRTFINEKCQIIADAIKSRLVMTSDQALRDVRKEQIDLIIKSVESVARRIMSKPDRDKQSEVLRLELCNKSLISNYLERRIQGIRDLSTVVKNNMTQSASTFTTDFLVEWMSKNNVFATVWDHRKTHLQIVQRTNEIFKLLVKSGNMDEPMLKLFWSLGKADHNLQTEVFKIISESAQHLKPWHVEFFFTELVSQPTEKLSLTEFDCLCDLGQHCSEFQPKVRDFFYQIILNANSYKDELVDNCIAKYAQMVRDQPVDAKKQILAQLTQQFSSTAIIPILKLFTKLVQKHETQQAATTSSYPYCTVALPPAATYSHVKADGTVITSYSYAQSQPTNPQDQSPPKPDLMKQTLNELQDELGLVDLLLENLVVYCKSVRAAGVESSTEPRKLFAVSKACSHYDEVNERLQFLKFFASECDYRFKKEKLRVIYDSLTIHSPVTQDQTEFLTWCKQACEVANSPVLDLNEVGEFFSELLLNKSLDVMTLPLAGFEFLSNYFISVNESQLNLVKVTKPKETQKTWQNWNELQVAKEEASVQDFVIIVKPSELSNIDLIWMVLLQAKDPDVAKKAIEFMIRTYVSLGESLKKEQASILQQLLSKLIQLLQDPQIATSQVERIVLMIKCVIEETEKKGAQGLQPHSAILKGEVLDKIYIKNTTKPHASNLVVKVYTSATVFEFVNTVSRAIGLAPQFVVFNLKNGYAIKEQDNGKTLDELGFKNHDIVTVSKLYTSDYGVEAAPLIDPMTNKLTDRVRMIFSEWYDLYSNEDGVMTPESATRFILGAINEVVSKDDSRVKILFSQDANGDGILEREEFISWYESACRSKAETVFENMANHFIRKDLLKMSDVYEPQQFQKLEMPRYTLSHNQAQFETLFGLLERKDESSPSVWQLIRMLVTNKQTYESVRDMKQDWKSFFEQGSIERQIYQYEIIESLMEDSHTTDRVFLTEFTDARVNRVQKPQNQDQHTDESIRQTWLDMFMQTGGLQYIINEWHNNFEMSLTGFQLQKIKFMVFVLKVYFHTDAEIEVGPLATRLLSLVHQIIKLDQHTSEQKQLVYNALSLWTQCQLSEFKCDWPFKVPDETGDFLLTGLLYCTEEKIRQEFQLTFLTLAQEIPPLHSFLLKLLSQNFFRINEYPCRQFFDLLNGLIDIHFAKLADGTEEKGLLNAEALLSQIIDKIRADKLSGQVVPLDELSMQQQAQDKESLMVGLVLLTGKIISKVDKELSEKIVRDKDLINELFKEFLFASVFVDDRNKPLEPSSMQEIISNKAPRIVKIQSSNKQANKSREAAYQLLNELIKKSPVILTNFIRDQLQPLLDLIKKPKTWNYTPPSSSERVQKYVGLKNLGCICYMNSMMQQFFMIPAFRYNLLCVDDGQPEQIKEYKGEQIDDNMLHQLQRLFAHLELSERFDYNPLGFTFSFKEMDGQPTNIAEQKDAQEFLTVMFDRLERALAPTSRKYLLQSVFGGKNCSQLICPECGKVSNRVEDFYNLSLTVKDLNSVYDSLQKQIEGELINDYKCDGCNKKVDITKRTLMCETPNVLIVHLQRLLFDFDTFRNEKMNQHFEFPSILDLKDYSYHEVMRREKQEPVEDAPILDDCWEYKLVGVNVHSGSANAGHYWSYINTVRGKDERDDNTWVETEKDQWMEFNDSTVRDYKFDNLFGECFGDKQSAQPQVSAWGYEMNTSTYGKSAYMLIYERRQKKPIRIVVQDASEGVYDEKTKEYIKSIPYRQVVGQETPNQIFSKVLEDNTKFSFENDIYSAEFFNFLKQILESVAKFGETSPDMSELRTLGIKVAQKAAFDILARCFHNSGIKDITQIMITILTQDTVLLSNFFKSMIANEESLFQILLECTDSSARTAIGDLFLYLVCLLKMQDFEVAASFIDLMCKGLLTHAAKNWARFDKYNEILLAFAIYSPEQALMLTQDRKIDQWTADSEAAQLGLTHFFKSNMLERILDFVMMDKSPLLKPGETRAQMGGSYNGPNFTSLMQIVTVMTSQQALLQQYPQSPLCVQMMTHKEILSKIIEAQSKSKSLNQSLAQMCAGNLTMSRKIAKIIFKQVNQNSADRAIESLKLIKAFLLVDDEFKRHRCEWILGVPQLVSRNKMYGLELVNLIQDEAYKYPSTLATTMGEISLLNQMLLQVGRQDQFCVKALKAVMNLCLQDYQIAEYIYRLPPPTYQYAHYTDWFGAYLKAQKEEMDKMNQYSYYAAKIKSATSAIKLFSQFEAILKKLQDSEAAQLWDASAHESFDLVRQSWMFENDNVLKCYPPQLIIGKQVGMGVVCAEYEDDYVVVQAVEQEHEWMVSNPTGMFNLSLADKMFRTKNYTTMSYQQYQNLMACEDTETRTWHEHASIEPVVLVVQVRSKTSGLLKVEVSISTSDTNLQVPVTPMRQSVFSSDPKQFGVFTKAQPSLPFGKIALRVQTNGSSINPPVRHIVTTYTETKTFNCSNCQRLAYDGMEFCEQCGESLRDDACYDDYFQ